MAVDRVIEYGTSYGSAEARKYFGKLSAQIWDYQFLELAFRCIITAQFGSVR